MSEMKRGFKGIWIPAEIWFADNLSIQEMIFLVEIDSLDNENGCYASNKHFADFFKLTKARVSQVIGSLEKKGFIKIKYIYKSEKEIEKRIIRVTENLGDLLNNHNTLVNKINPPSKFTKPPYLENYKGSNTKSSNTKSNNTIYIYTVFEFWNEQKIIQHRELTQKRKSAINARLKNYTPDELKKAIKNYAEILNGDMYYWTHKWSLEDFMNPKNLERFTDEANPFNNYAKTGNKKQKTGTAGDWAW